MALEGFEPDAQEAVKEFLTPKTTPSTPPTPAKPPTNTDLVTRGLIMDYVGLEANGQATDANIEALAIKYAESVPAINQAETVSFLDLKLVGNTKANLDNYTNEFSKISITHSIKLNNIYIKAGSSSISPIYTQAPAVYAQTANALENLAIPSVLAQSHLDLINLHLSSAAATKAMTQTGENPAAELAGLVTWNQNMDQEIIILQKIESLLKTNGT